MSEPYIGEIRQFAGNFAPAGWLFCNGQLLPISEYDALFALIGTTYGGDGQTNFALPNLQGRVPIHMGSALGTTFTIGSTVGTENVQLTTNQIPSHSHSLGVAATATTSAPGGNLLAPPSTGDLFLEDTPSAAMNASSIAASGGSQPHSNMAPYLCVSFIIAVYGIFPSPA
ncbi:tail fiber protein [Deinococcus soli (ex Cha et al. 2016)]|uniref:Microcystin-dependent protein n=2 Tax=Deinococcus soli (ex Cha et al. 2016) TaxID=1309411 RepID=A0ACC6KB68_9DEIO|nr:tail fiber protein [Deinococcus soli (ex Cha et al. 2016)]MDR6216605.1 microcystin-dependent protein [Deinococcus soli (ex Cha et al. 2016)]MDR6327426.1 microcystin-dependent protein [Deinococcus soli (ex Cha et al. 2016)]MDR6749701.1 microcystin-dependent protein [Deinococcus soli (ex Cha et al. 2016)]